jgi:hypothetical protein
VDARKDALEIISSSLGVEKAERFAVPVEMESRAKGI